MDAEEKWPKRGCGVVGLTEVNSTSVEGLTPRKINYTRTMEARKERAADERIEKAKRRRARARQDKTRNAQCVPKKHSTF